MITYIEKGAGLHSHIAENGFSLEQIDGVWISSDDLAVQVLIDDYDPLTPAKLEAKARLTEQAEKSLSAIYNQYPGFERQTWADQESEARNWVNDNAVATPTVSALALQRGVDKEILMAKIIANADAWRQLAATYAGERQRLEDLIDDSNDFNGITTINFIPPSV